MPLTELNICYDLFVTYVLFSCKKKAKKACNLSCWERLHVLVESYRSKYVYLV